MESFRHYGKPYDFNFDFTSDDALVCSELVYKSYLSTGKLALPMTQVNGRPVLPPNIIARYADEDDETGTTQLHCVLFLESSVKNGQVTASPPEAFAGSWSRSKWSSMQR